MGLSHRMLPFPPPYYHITKSLSIADPSAQYIVSDYQEEITRILSVVWREMNIRTRLIYNRDLELSDQKFKAAMINMPRTLMNTVDSMKEQMGNASWQWKF